MSVNYKPYSSDLVNDSKLSLNNNSANNMDGNLNNSTTSRPSSSNGKSRSPSPTRPLLKIRPHEGAPLANLETFDEPDDREIVTKPYPGVDDGFFNNEDANNKPTEEEEEGNPDVELIPIRPKDPEDLDNHNPRVTPRIGGDGDSSDPDKRRPSAGQPKVPPTSNHPDFPNSPGFRPWGFDFEVGSTLPSGETIPDLNVYQHKKTLAQGMMDLALFSANANQLRYVLETFRSHPYFYPSVVLISLSLILQVAVGIGLIWNATYNVKDKKALCVANRINNMTTIFVFLITVINVFISAFGVAPAPT
ncbi:unnamed protein product [Ceutorhynchus assimilis]|uniref:Ninjurin-1 n=1 Tax=Ceutorhynchus assimilis TaxID=467358 RepID=A0A9N9MZH2_9CUCU|nr:unnamed protein product [Ceutorhynchus assimilis]